MLDWLTLRVDASILDEAALASFRSSQDRILRLDPGGAIKWEIPAHESIRSDSHQVTVRLGSDLSIKGSPARVMGKDNVFGSDDIVACAQAMLSFVAQTREITLPRYTAWRLTRADITHNYDLGSAAAVRQALHELSIAEGGRYQKQCHAGTVYWSSRSSVRSGKAYAKGPHMLVQVRAGKASFTEEEMELGQRLLRLELQLKSWYWREQAQKPWYEYTANDFQRIHEEYFTPLIGTIEVVQMDNVREKCIDAAQQLGKPESWGMGAYRYWVLIREVGFEEARALTPRTSHYRYLKTLRLAGLGYADFQARNITPLRRKPVILGEPSRSWCELRGRKAA